MPRSAAWKAANPNYDREYAATHREKLNAKARNWNASHRERAREITRQSRLRHLEAARERKRIWNRTHRAYKAHRNRLRRTRLLAVPAELLLTLADERALLASRTRCPLCRREMCAEAGSDRSKQLDHIIPINRGGTHIAANVRVVCARCNQTRPRDGSDVVGQLDLFSGVHA